MLSRAVKKKSMHRNVVPSKASKRDNSKVLLAIEVAISPTATPHPSARSKFKIHNPRMMIYYRKDLVRRPSRAPTASNTPMIKSSTFRQTWLKSLNSALHDFSVRYGQTRRQTVIILRKSR